MKYTKDQITAIEEHGQDILVSAAAGAGKTAVLVERIIQSLLRKEDPVDIDRILVMTFTKAAAGEMRERILAAINERLRAGNADRHLYRQATLIHNAHISTIHGFCLDVIRNHFHRIGLSPDFRTMNEAESKLMMADALQAVLEEAYEQGDPAFLRMSEHIATGKTDKALENAIQKLYGFAVSNPDVDAWFDTCLRMYDEIDEKSFDRHPMVISLIRDCRMQISELLSAAERALEYTGLPDGPYMYTDAITGDIKMLEALSKCDTYREFADIAGAYEPLRLGRAVKDGPEVDPELRDLAKDHRDRIKNSLNGMKKLFAPDEKQIIEQMRKCRDDVAALIDITRVFKARFDEMKHIRGLIDFNDMEHDCLKILKENPSIADEYRAFFKEIYVDEYQDSNLVQETIVNAIADHNVFNVGDVKQSIYRFRMARPELFLQKYQTYGKGKAGLRIDLHDNFRSRVEVINAVNEVFGRIMRKEIGGIDYDDDAALKYGATYYDENEEDNKITDDINADRNAPENNEKTTQSVDKMPVTNDDYENITGDPEPVNSFDPCGHNPYVAEYVGIMKNEETDPKELEATYIARRISDLISSGLPVYDKQLKELRPIRYSDIVILLRATRGWDDVFCRVIGGYGIPIHATSVTGYFSAREIVWLLSYLQVIDNPLQDIPLAAVLRSPIGKVNDTELAMIRAEHKKMPLYQNLCDFASKTTDEVNTPVIEKVRDFLARLEDLRVRSAYTSVYEILQEIVDGDYGRAILSSPGGERGYANLNMLLSHALEFGKTSYRGLFQFVRYIECLKKNEIDYGEAGLAGENENVVRLMSIHKSKGLEFPVVFLSGMHKNLNFRDAYDPLVQDADLGIGIALIDSERRTRQATLSKNVISRKILCDNLAEEIRVLYVGMTRAREKLIMTGIAKKEDYVLGGCPVLAKADSYRALLDYAGGRRGFGHIDVYAADVTDLIDSGMQEEIRREDIRLSMIASVRGGTSPERTPLFERLQFAYPEDPNDHYGKISVTELKKRSMQLAEAEEFEDGEADPAAWGPKKSTTEEHEVIPIVPGFLSGPNKIISPTEHGTAFHRLLEIWDYSLPEDADSVEAFFEKTAKQKRMEADMLDMLNPAEILRFLKTELAGRMKKAFLAGTLYREQPFVIRMDNGMLVQGIIDAFFIEDGKIVVVDYKTDRVRSEKILKDRYRVQLEYYDRALSRLMKLPVSERVIYAAVSGRTISV